MKLSYLRNAAIAVFVSVSVNFAGAQGVVFPGQTQPGAAMLNETNGIYTLSNDLFSVAFVKEGSTLKFGGCQQLNLNPGSEIFILNLGDNSSVPASAMTLKSVTTAAIAPEPQAVKAGNHFAGHMVKAEFEGSGLNVIWRAILRDGANYFRTEMDITPLSEAVSMNSIVAMLYDVENVEGHTAPAVVGNTRGAVIANDIMFAGIETPMGKNSIIGDDADLAVFDHDTWTPASWDWAPGSQTPTEIIDEVRTISGKKLNDSNIIGTRGYRVLCDEGEQTIIFEYSGGSHRLNIVGVDIVDPTTGKVVSADYHAGYTGSQKQDNEYTLHIPAKGCYIIRYFAETLTETITSSGNITYSCRVAIPELHYGEEPAAAKTPIRRILSKNDLNEFSDGDDDTDTWTGTSWTKTGEANVPYRVKELGINVDDVRHMKRPVKFNDAATLTVTFQYTRGNHRIDVCGVDIVDSDNNVVAYDYHLGFSGSQKSENVYKFDVPYEGEFTLRYFAYNADNALNTNGDISLAYDKVYHVYLPIPKSQTIQGLWSRPVALDEGITWNVSAVAGIIAPDQARRSVAYYVERERAVPWRAYPIYNSWFELCINRNNDKNYTTNMNANQCIEVVSEWKKNLYQKYGANINAFVWDDGWDIYGTWEFNPNFPNGFTDIDKVARTMHTGIGAWLGPVGGYGQSGNYRRQYWSTRGGMQLSNPKYYKVFLDQCSYMINNYDFRFFKFDGISALFAAFGPDPNNEEGAEAIIDIERRLREIKPDIFLNTTVGTWASPFWYSVSDCTWRQEADYGKIGNNSIDREQWITYRDRLIYQNYVVGSPLCPINSIMSHGLILTEHERPCSYSQDYKAVLNEMRCAFISGASMVELYTDFPLMNSIEGPDGTEGKLWEDMAECIFWQQNNADVLPDIHWVGGNPWTGSRHEVYGWASWNGTKSTLALRNGDNNAKTFKTTLRQALDIPAHIKGSVKLKSSFKAQEALEGMPEFDTPIDIDQELNLTLPGSSVYCFDGIDAAKEWPVYPEPVLPGEEDDSISEINADRTDAVTYDLQGRRVLAPTAPGLYIRAGRVIRL